MGETPYSISFSPWLWRERSWKVHTSQCDFSILHQANQTGKSKIELSCLLYQYLFAPQCRRLALHGALSHVQFVYVHMHILILDYNHTCTARYPSQ